MINQMMIAAMIMLIISGCRLEKSTDEQIMDIPYFQQSESGNCVQTNMKMVLKYFHQDKDFSFEYLDNITGRTEGKWTWPAQALKPLVDNCLDTYFCSITPYENITPDFLTIHYGEADGNKMIQQTNWDVLPDAIDYLLASGRYEHKNTTFEELENEFMKGSVIIVTLRFHQVTITGINETHVLVHDPASRPFRVYLKESFKDIWYSSPSDNDIFIIKGIISGCEI